MVAAIKMKHNTQIQKNVLLRSRRIKNYRRFPEIPRLVDTLQCGSGEG